MCGVVAVLGYGDRAPPVDLDALNRVRDAMAARGPDGYGTWMDDDHRIGLAHRRLAILDLSEAGAQPMATADGSLRVVYNGEIYNYPALRADLEQRGFVFRSNSDTEILLHLYRHEGMEMVQRLRGMFAFALWDADRQGLLLGRDPFGIKPLYYADDGDTLRIASSVKALLRGGRIDTSVEPAGHVGFFLWGHVPEPHTLYRGIRALPAGTILWADRAHGVERPRRFFGVTQELEAAESRGRAPYLRRIDEEFAAAFEASIRCHMLSDVPVGVFLSSGLDSSSIAVVASACSSGPPRTVTLGFSEFRQTINDEVPLAETMAKQLGFVHQTSWVSQQEFARERDRLLAAMDQPTIDGVNSYFVSKAAKEAGLKVVLSGLGGDELLAGYPSFEQIPKLVRMVRPFRICGKGFRLLSTPLLRRLTSPKYAGVLEYGGSYGGAYLLRRGLFMPWELPEMLDRDLVREGWRELDLLTRLEETTASIVSPRLRVSALEISWYMRNQLLRDADWASMAHSLELRVPLVDAELLRAVTPFMVVSPPSRRQLMAAASRGLLPRGVLERAKTGFSIPVHQWLARPGEDAQRGLRGWARTIYREFARGPRC